MGFFRDRKSKEFLASEKSSGHMIGIISKKVNLEEEKNIHQF